MKDVTQINKWFYVSLATNLTCFVLSMQELLSPTASPITAVWVVFTGALTLWTATNIVIMRSESKLATVKGKI